MLMNWSNLAAAAHTVAHHQAMRAGVWSKHTWNALQVVEISLH
jgi:hypothetical protein